MNKERKKMIENTSEVKHKYWKTQISEVTHEGVMARG
jgi:hypothetical protein